MFKDEFRKLRNDKGYTQEDLAKELGVSKSTISMYESGSRIPGLEMLEAIADFFNIDMNRLTTSKQAEIAPQDPMFFRLKKGLETYNVDEKDIDFLLTVMKAHKERNK